MDFTTLITYSLAVFGVSFLVTTQEGPYHIFTRVHSWLFPKGASTDEINHFLKNTLKGNIYSILTCPYCLGVYLSFLILIPNLVHNFGLQPLVVYVVNSLTIYGLHTILIKIFVDEAFNVF